VYDGYHYAIDVIAGGLLGAAVGLAFVVQKQLVTSS
jgi:membrane-associated phospholipid phosphatase